MENTPLGLEFESPILSIEAEIRQLQQLDSRDEATEEKIRLLSRQWTETTREIYGKLNPWQIVQVSRHKERPYTRDYLNLAFDEFIELHGDKFFGDDRAMLTGFAKLDRYKVMVVGHQKGRTYKERSACHFGCAHPEGYRKAMSKMKLAEKYGLPIICFIDTPGAFPGIGAEERGQSQVIAESMFLMSQLKTPIICIVIGEGGSGGALGSESATESPCFSTPTTASSVPKAVRASCGRAISSLPTLRSPSFHSKHLAHLGIVDDVIEEPLGGSSGSPADGGAAEIVFGQNSRAASVAAEREIDRRSL